MAAMMENPMHDMEFTEEEEQEATAISGTAAERSPEEEAANNPAWLDYTSPKLGDNDEVLIALNLFPHKVQATMKAYDMSNDGHISPRELAAATHAYEKAKDTARFYQLLALALSAGSIVFMGVVLGIAIAANEISKETHATAAAQLSDTEGNVMKTAPSTETTTLLVTPVLDRASLHSIRHLAVTVPHTRMPFVIGSSKASGSKEVGFRITGFERFNNTAIKFRTHDPGTDVYVWNGAAFVVTTNTGCEELIRVGGVNRSACPPRLALPICAADAECSSFNVAGVDSVARTAEARAALSSIGLASSSASESTSARQRFRASGFNEFAAGLVSFVQPSSAAKSGPCGGSPEARLPELV